MSATGAGFSVISLRFYGIRGADIEEANSVGHVRSRLSLSPTRFDGKDAGLFKYGQKPLDCSGSDT